MSDVSDDRKADATAVWLEPHSESWRNQAIAESARLASALGDNLLRIEHIGSTAIPGIAAKPIVDLLPVVRDLVSAEASRPDIEALGYVWRGEFGIEGRRYCVLMRNGARLAHVHIFEEGHAQVALNTAFRDYLRAHRTEALAYEAVKRRAAEAHPTDSLAYNDQKSDWIRGCQRRALAWAAARDAS